jgi:NAD(P)-dependent dehydrogenase (short-subunit alcohol dehydrogenase family)
MTTQKTAQKTAVITGATSGLGEAAAAALAGEGLRVLLVGRDAARGAEVVKRIQAAGGSAEMIVADLFSRADVARLAGELGARAPRIDVLVNNAGGSFSKTERTADGLERTFALNVAAPFALTEALLPNLAAARGRVVNIVTGVPNGARARVDDLAGPGAKAGMGAYVSAKLALLALTVAWQLRHAERGVVFVALHPGIIPGTRFGQEMPAFLRTIGEGVARVFGLASTPAEAAARYVAAALGPATPGGFYYEGKLRAPPKGATDAAFAEGLVAALTPASAATPRAA